jgi:hypothetical protein
MNKSFVLFLILVLLIICFCFIFFGFLFIQKFLNMQIYNDEMIEDEIDKSGIYFINNENGFNFKQATNKCKQYKGKLCDPSEFKNIAERDKWFTCQYGWAEEKDGTPVSIMYNDKKASGCPQGFFINKNTNKDIKQGVYCDGPIPNEALTYSIY